jgi:hypothetical protein
MSSRDILTITFSLSDKPHTLEYGKGMTGREKKDVKTITYKISDLDTTNKEETGELNDDGSKSLNEFTQKLTSSIKTFRALLPPSVTSYYDEKVVNELIEHQQHFMDGKSVANKLMEKGDTETVLPSVDTYLAKWGGDTCRDLIKSKVNENSSKSPSDSDKIAQITKLVTNHEIIGVAGVGVAEVSVAGVGLNKSEKNTERIKYNTAVLKDALYVGLFNYNTINMNDSEKLHVFLTNKGVLTDGYAILPDTTDVKITGDNLEFKNTYTSLWKLANKDNNGGNTATRVFMGGPETKQFDYSDMEALLGDKAYTTEYDRAIYFLNTTQKYGGQKTLSNRPSKKHGTRRRR